MSIELHARGWENFLYATGLMDEAGVTWKPSGGNVLRVPDDTFDRLDADQLAELAGVVRNPIEVRSDPQPTVADSSPADAPPGASTGPAGDAAPTVAAPPRSGAGATRDAWAAYASRLGLTVPPGASRDDLIVMIEQQEARGGS